MTWTIVIAALLAVATVWFIARPLRRAQPADPERESRDALIQVRDRLLAQLRELDIEIGDRNVDPAVAADERRRLEAELAQVLKRLDEERPEAKRAHGAPRPRLWLATVIVLAVVLPLAAGGLYLAQNRTVLAQLDRLQGFARGEVPPMVLEMVERLEQRLAEQPGQSDGWARLGRAYAVLGREADAREAYARALDLAPEDTEIMAAYADFLLSISPTRPSAEAIALFRKVHAADPGDAGALWALGVAAYQDQDFGQAVRYWEKLLAQMPPEHELTTELRRALEVARAQAAEQK